VAAKVGTAAAETVEIAIATFVIAVTEAAIATEAATGAKAAAARLAIATVQQHGLQQEQ